MSHAVQELINGSLLINCTELMKSNHSQVKTWKKKCLKLPWYGSSVENRSLLALNQTLQYWIYIMSENQLIGGLIMH